MADDDYITVEDAAAILGVTPRQANRYGSGNAPRIRTQRAGRRILYHRGDVEALADGLGAHRRLAPAQPARADLIPAGEMLDYLRERDARIDALQDRVSTLERENGELRGQLRALLGPPPRRPWWRFWTRDRRT